MSANGYCVFCATPRGKRGPTKYVGGIGWTHLECLRDARNRGFRL